MGGAWRTWPTGEQNMISVDLTVVTNVMLDLWDWETFQDYCNLNLGGLGKLQWILWASWRRQDRGGRRGRGTNHLLQFSSIAG